MQKINVITEGDHKGHLVVFSRGSLWINIGMLGLKRMAPEDLYRAVVKDAQKRIISVIFKDGSRCSVLMGPKLFSAALDSLSPLFAEDELKSARRTLKASRNVQEGISTSGGEKKPPSKITSRKAPLPAIILAATGLVLLLLLKLTGKI